MKTLTKEATATRRAIRKQLLTSTGTAMMDSGGEDGRAWQRNQKTGIRFGQGLQVERWGATIPVQDYMLHCFERTPRAVALEKELKRRIRTAFPSEPVGLTYAEGSAIADALNEMGATGNEGRKLEWWNTYNDETDLSQVLQMLTFELDGTCFAIVQVHQGADVRGGYTDGKVYEVPDPYTLYDVRAEATVPDGSYEVNFYEAEKHGMTWNEDAQCHQWPDGTPVEWTARF